MILGSSYNCKIDVWSLGCILAEIITGDPILDWDTIPEFLAKLKYIIGDLPKEGKLL